jgi:hypothetical protein
MAKALYGHMVMTDRRLAAENARLRQRVRDLEERLEQLELQHALDLSELESGLDRHLDRDLLGSAAG